MHVGRVALYDSYIGKQEMWALILDGLIHMGVQSIELKTKVLLFISILAIYKFLELVS